MELQFSNITRSVNGQLLELSYDYSFINDWEDYESALGNLHCSTIKDEREIGLLPKQSQYIVIFSVL